MSDNRVTAEEALRRIATELTALAFNVPASDRAEAARLRQLAELADDARVALCTCPQPWQGTPQPHTILCALVRLVKPLGGRTTNSICTTCRSPIHWIDCPTGGWWAHNTHPADGHDALTRNVPPEPEDPS